MVNMRQLLVADALFRITPTHPLTGLSSWALNFRRCLKQVLTREPGFPRDPGNPGKPWLPWERENIFQ